MSAPIMKYFEYAHLPEKLQQVSKPIGDLAKLMDEDLPDGAEKSAGLRKLLEAKDCLVRAALPAIFLLILLVGCGSPTPSPAPRAPRTAAHVYGWHRSTRPSPHHRYAIEPENRSLALPATLDLRPGCPPVYDQGQLGSCTANALAGVHQYLQIKQGLAPSFVPSRLMLYYGERQIEGTIPTDAGANGDDGVTFLRDTGVCPEPTWPYVISKFATDPPPLAWSQAPAHKVTGPETLDGTDLVQLKTWLVTKKIPIAFGFTAYPELESTQVAATGLLPMPAQGEQSIGGHEVEIVGYDDAKSAFLCRNSWGASWGLAGYFWMPYAYATDPGLSGDFRSFRAVEAPASR